MRPIIILGLLSYYASLYTQPIYFYCDSHSDFPPVYIEGTANIIQLDQPIELDTSWTHSGCELLISEEGKVDSVYCHLPYEKDLYIFFSSAQFTPGIMFNDQFCNMRTYALIQHLNFNPTTEIQIWFYNRVENGSTVLDNRYSFDLNEYAIAYENSVFNRDFPKNLDRSIQYVDFNILVDSILRINRLGRYVIPDRKGFSVKIHGDLLREHFMLINLRRNRKVVLDNLSLNLEPGDHYLLVCQLNEGIDSRLFITRFLLDKDLEITPNYQKITYLELRNQITIR